MTRLSDAELQQRAWDLRQAIHSVRMEGGDVTPEAVAIMEAFARGEIDEVEQDRRVRELIEQMIRA